MSAYGHEMEREYSAQSLSTRGGSELGSRYSTEPGVYMSQFAATVFISGLIIIGISLLSLLVSLTVLLSSCESKKSGAIEIYRHTQSYDYCRNLALHAELNRLSEDYFPTICKDINTQYVKQGQYRKDLNITVGFVEDFLGSLKLRPQKDGHDVVMMDADDLLASKTLHKNRLIYRVEEDANYLKHVFVVDLYQKLISHQWPLILLSRRPDQLRNTTVEYLRSVGVYGWSSLVMRMDNEMQMDFEEFISRQRSVMQREGLRIIAVISSQMDALSGPHLGNRLFKIPNPIVRYSTKNEIEEE